MNDPISMPRWWLALTKVLCEADSNAALRLRQLRGQVPFQLFHLWQADVVMPMLCEALPEHQQALLALQSLHQRAALGVIGRQGEWRATLKPVLLALYRKAYPYDAAYAKAHASAMTYGLAPANRAMIAEHFGDAVELTNYDNPEQIRLDLLAGRIDATLGPKINWTLELISKPEGKDWKLDGGEFWTGDPSIPEA